MKVLLPPTILFLACFLILNTYMEGRGEKKLKFNPSMEIKNPFGVQEMF